jgi:hypothetical protein
MESGLNEVRISDMATSCTVSSPRVMRTHARTWGKIGAKQLWLFALIFAMLHGPSTQQVVQFHHLDCRRSRFILRKTESCQRLQSTFHSVNFFYCIFTIYSRYIKIAVSKRDGCKYLKQVPSIDGSLEHIWWDPLATFCWVFFLFQVEWTGLWLVGCRFVQSEFLWFFAHVLMTSVTYGMRKVTFNMYQGALPSFLNFWIETFGEFFC